MDRSDVIRLVSKTYTVDAIGQRVPVEELKTVYADVASVTRSEFFTAGQNGLNPAYKITMFAYDYNGEDEVEYKGNRYSVYRTFFGRNDTIELYTERKAVNV